MNSGLLLNALMKPPDKKEPRQRLTGEARHDRRVCTHTSRSSQTQTAMAMDRQSDGLLPSCKVHTPAYSESELPPPLRRVGVLLSRGKKNLGGAPPEFCLSIHRRGAANPFKNTPHKGEVFLKEKTSRSFRFAPAPPCLDGSGAELAENSLRLLLARREEA